VGRRGTSESLFKLRWDVDPEVEEWVLRDEGLLGPASIVIERDSGIEGNSVGEPGRDSAGRIGVLIEILRECGCEVGIAVPTGLLEGKGGTIINIIPESQYSRLTLPAERPNHFLRSHLPLIPESPTPTLSRVSFTQSKILTLSPSLWTTNDHLAIPRPSGSGSGVSTW